MSEVPRKFDMKIALLNQKEAETNASFASIIAEIKSIDSKNTKLTIDQGIRLVSVYGCQIHQSKSTQNGAHFIASQQNLIPKGHFIQLPYPNFGPVNNQNQILECIKIHNYNQKSIPLKKRKYFVF